MTGASAPVHRGARLTRSARRAQLLDAARDVFAAQGYHAAAMDDIAEKAGVSKPVLYQHFPGKLELYRALLTTYADELVERVRGALSHRGDNQERAKAAVAATSTSWPTRRAPTG
jgi:AcrR family transcriptional regulator